jgi:2,3-bisphosphoglycerate-dependent phosphoglycerate mutase
LAGLSRKDADWLYPYVENLPINQAMYGQESMVEFRNRAVNVLQKVLSENSSEAVVALVTHGGMVNQLYGALLHMPIGEDCFFCTADTGIHIWEITDHGSYVRKANIDDHIKGM